MSLRDFCALSPEQFNAAYRAYWDGETARMRDGWERTRTLVVTMASSLGAKKTAHQLLPLPWDEGASETEERTSQIKSTPEIFGKLINKLKDV